ncbi:MAG: response regulator [Roseivirga sp.]|nr:response regulator [Roseivirga sp.]
MINNRLRLVFSLLMLCALSWSANAQDLILSKKALTMEEGLSSLNPGKPHMGKNGFIWVPSALGLDRYDGTRFLHFSSGGSDLPANQKPIIQHDQQGNLWLHYFGKSSEQVASYDLRIFDLSKQQFLKFEEYIGAPPVATDQIVTSYLNLDNQFSLATAQGQIYRRTGNAFKLAFQDEQKRRILQVFQYKPETTWVVYKKTLVQYDRNWKIIKEYPKVHSRAVPISNLINPSFEDAQGKLHYRANDTYYVDGEPQNGLTEYPGSAFLLIHPEYQHKVYYQIQEEKQVSRLLVLDKDNKLIKETAIPPSKMNHFLRDSQDNIWLVNRGLMIVRISESPFRKYLQNHQIDGGTPYQTRGIYEEKGHLFVSGSGQSYRINKATGAMEILDPDFLFSDPLRGKRTASNIRRAIAPDMQGNIFLSDESYRLLKYVPSKKRFHEFTYGLDFFEKAKKQPDLPIPEHHRALLWSKKNTLWLGHNLGLSFLDEKRKELQYIPNTDGMSALKGAEVFFIHENDSGFWLATTQGLYLFDPINKVIIEHFGTNGDDQHYLPSNNYVHVYEDANGILWLSSRGGGLIKFNPKDFTHQQFTEKDGLTNNVVYAAYEDHRQNLWLPTDKGLNRFNKESLEFYSYQESDGIAHHEFNNGSHYRGEDSTLYFGGVAGITAFHPSETYKGDNLAKNPIVITKAARQDGSSGEFSDVLTELKAEGAFVMKPDHISLQIEFSHLDYGSFKDKQFAYKVNGIDLDWTYLKDPELRISALPYGRFELALKAQEQNGEWSEVLTYPLIVPRPFYLRWWFFLLSILLIAGIVYAYFRYRLIKLQKDQEYLEDLVQSRTAEVTAQAKALAHQAGELKRLDTAKSQFFANISHELRTPLTLIMGPINDFIRNDKLNRKDLVQMQRMFRNTKSLSNLVEEILELSKLEAGKLEIDKVPVSLAPFLRRLFAGFESLAITKGIDFNFHGNFDDSVMLNLDANKLEKVINNLLSNALKFTPNEGTVSMKARLDKQSFHLAVQDSGIGISEKDLPYIFDRFYQVQVKEMSLVQGGTGIGLALIKELVNAMDGEVKVESEEGLGTTFSIILPKEEVGEDYQSTPAQTDIASVEVAEESFPIDPFEPKGQRLLLVEDHKDMRQYIYGLLSAHYEVDLAMNGVKALEALKNSTYDLVVTDVMMPEMDGFTLLRRIKANPLYQHLPVVMLTARAEAEDKLNALTIGVDDYLTKPFLKEELLARVSNLLSHAKVRQASAGEPMEVERPDGQLVSMIPQLVSKVDIEWIKRVEKEVQTRMNDIDFSLDTLAAILGTSARSFQRKLKELIGLTPQQYIREIKLQTARSILEKKAYHSIAEVAQAVGFQSTKHFAKIFRERYGKSPKEYLK